MSEAGIGLGHPESYRDHLGYVPTHSLHYREGGSLVVVVLAVADRPIELCS